MKINYGVKVDLIQELVVFIKYMFNWVGGY